MEFAATVELHGKTATGIEVPEDVIAALGESERPAVTVSLNGHTYRTTVGRMGGKFLVPVSAEQRTAAGVQAGDRVQVSLELDTAARTTEVPDDLAAALASSPEAAATWASCTVLANRSAPPSFLGRCSLTASQQKEWARWITEPKKPSDADRPGRACGRHAGRGRPDAVIASMA